ncbi:M15 family metallopeptidase [Galactobacter valiniphilus]|uniref:M15 family metallopeptidase n=1 Tax=Galactobacter valiniphilus TaxID=2676122 RepID=UPI0037356823
MSYPRRSALAAALAGAALLITSLPASPAAAAPLRTAVAVSAASRTAPAPTPTPTPVAAKPTPPKPPRDPRNIGVLVNKTHPLKPKSYVPKGLVRVNGQRMRAEPAKALTKLMRDAKRSGARIVTVSGYRSYSTQKALFARYTRAYGSAYAARISARPGYSEHQTGLTMDVGAANGACRLGSCFGNTKAGRWVAKNAWKYGYIVRYPKGQEKVTGYTYEPWHLRYVGVKISTAMKKGKIPTLEHYYGQVKRR